MTKKHKPKPRQPLREPVDRKRDSEPRVRESPTKIYDRNYWKGTKYAALASSVSSTRAREFRGDRPLGTPLSELSGQPGDPNNPNDPRHAGYAEFCRIARSYGYD